MAWTQAEKDDAHDKITALRAELYKLETKIDRGEILPSVLTDLQFAQMAVEIAVLVAANASS